MLLLFTGLLAACSAPPAPEDDAEPTMETEAPEPEPASEPAPEPASEPPYIPALAPDAPSWEVALDEFLREFLPIFTPGTLVPYSWVDWEWEVGGWGHFVREYTFEDEREHTLTDYYLADPVTGETVDADDVPWQYEAWATTFIATDFYLHDIDGDGIPTLLIRWHPLGGDFEGVQMFRYIDGIYTPMRVSVRHFWNLDEAADTPFLFSTAIFSGGSELLARDSEVRTLTLGIGGAGGFGTWAYVLHMDDDAVRLEPAFNIRFGMGFFGEDWGLHLYIDESITGERASLPEIEEEDALFFPWEWLDGEGDMTPVPIPIMPDVTVAPFPRMTDLERQLTERITARLLAEGRILSQ